MYYFTRFYSNFIYYLHYFFIYCFIFNEIYKIDVEVLVSSQKLFFPFLFIYFFFKNHCKNVFQVKFMNVTKDLNVCENTLAFFNYHIGLSFGVLFLFPSIFITIYKEDLLPLFVLFINC
jgi:hypothetical protein